MAKCIMCNRKPGDILVFDNSREVAVKLSNGRYGKLCQRCKANAYSRGTTRNKRQREQESERKRIEDVHGQMNMFNDE